jgi:hypothetical protein
MKKGNRIQNMLSRTNECSGVFNIKSKKEVQSSQLLFQLNKKQILYITMDSVVATIKNNILIVDDHPFIIQGYKNAPRDSNPNKYEFLISESKD